jgi:thioesterase domain-containing protein
MASLYVKEMTELFPDGPYHLAGFSFGGLIALEMAIQLQAAGKQTGRITLIDTAAPHLFRLIIHKVSLSKKIEQWAYSLVIACCIVSGKPVPARYRNFYVIRSFRQAAHDYDPPDIGPPVSFRLIRSTRSVSDEPGLGWSQWQRFMPEIILVEGDHRSIIRDPELIRQFASHLVEGQTGFPLPVKFYPHQYQHNPLITNHQSP